MKSWIKAFTIFEKYCKNEYSVCTDHDLIYVTLESKPSIENALELYKLDWRVCDEECDNELLDDFMGTYQDVNAKNWIKFC